MSPRPTSLMQRIATFAVMAASGEVSWAALSGRSWVTSSDRCPDQLDQP
ncbi:hypothetical protein [Corallococcus sp. CA053C]|nr:hypothetical protein [Corallococcus sp. CA053C]